VINIGGQLHIVRAPNPNFITEGKGEAIKE
jgi:hypothetical protein